MSRPVDLFAGPAPRLYAIAPHERFLDVIARGMAAHSSATGIAVSDMTVLAPTRRAVRALGQAFLRAADSGRGVTYLPAIRAIGDIEADEPPFEPGEIALDLPPAISRSQRRFELAALVHAKAVARGDDPSPAAALPLADALGLLLDECASEGGADMAAVEALYERLPAHLQEVSTFLDIVQQAWPQRLAELGRIDEAARRDALLRMLAARWREHPPAGPVIAAGSTGTHPATAELLAAVAGLPQGCVVLPGLDQDIDAAAWEQVDVQHPQYGLKRLLELIGVERDAPQPWPGAADAKPARARRRLINEALRPADATADWPGRIEELKREAGPKAIEKGLEGLSIIEAADEDEEARAIALAIRETLETPGSTAMLVTPDSGLARRVSVALRRWSVEAESSAGAPLVQTRIGAYLAHLLELAQDPGDPVALAALLKHPLTSLGGDAEENAAAVAVLERTTLRGVRAGRALSDLRAKIARNRTWIETREAVSPDALTELVVRIENALEPLSAMGAAFANTADFAYAHARVAEAFVATKDEPGARFLWAGEDGEAAAQLMRELLSESARMPQLGLDDYARVFAELSQMRAVRPPATPAARVRILGPLEARLQSADLVVMGGLNEGAWPAPPPHDPFLSADMRKAAGLTPAERRYGLAAHDFAQLACAPRVVLTRAGRVEGAPAVASRWLWRLQTLCRGADAVPPTHHKGEADVAALAALMDRVAARDARPTAPPRPTPPVSARPRRLSVTRIRDWIRDPYALYAREILKLDHLQPLDRPPDARERGTALHDALFEMLNDAPAALGDDFAERLAALSLEKLRALGLDDGALAREAPRMTRAAEWFAEWEAQRRAGGWTPVILEKKGAFTFDAPGGEFTLFAKADRIDQGPTGWAVLDYKTGTPPTVRQAREFDPQLFLEGAILAAGGYDGAEAATPVVYGYVKFAGGRTLGDFFELSGKGLEPGFLTSEARGRLVKRVKRFDARETPYPSHPYPKFVKDEGDYDRLARRKEWSGPYAGEEA